MKTIAKFYVKETTDKEQINSFICSLELLLDEKLDFSINEYGKQYLVNSRLDFLSPIENEILYDKEIPLITNAAKDGMVVFSGNYLNNNFASTPMWYLTLEIDKKTENIPLVFGELTTTVNCFWSKISLVKTERITFDQSQPDYTTKENGLPKIPFPEKYDTPFLPVDLGWINYWPVPTLKRIGFKEQHRTLFYSVQDAANNGLILQITKEPLDFDIAEHLRKTVAIYDALPAIGGRDCV